MVQMKEPWFVGFNLFELFEMVSNGLRWFESVETLRATSPVFEMVSDGLRLFENVETLRATFLYFLWRYLSGIECQIRV